MRPSESSCPHRRPSPGYWIFIIFQCVFFSKLLCEDALSQSLPRETIRESVAEVARVVHDEYFDEQIARDVARELRDRTAKGMYDSVTSSNALAAMLTKELYTLTRDKHLAVFFIPEVAPSAIPPEEVRIAERERAGQRTNFGIQKVEILAGNIGYLNLTACFRPEEAREQIASAFQSLRYADALILDLRDNGGGSPDTAALVISYFLDESGVKLFEIVDRSGGTKRYTSETTPLPARHGSRPVYVLTSKRTFSAGEGLAFLLQERKRGQVIGEITAGAANPGRTYPATNQLEVNVPNGKVRSAISGNNWEGSGVIPDVQVSEKDAIRIASMNALRKLKENSNEKRWTQRLSGLLEELESANRQ